MNAQDATDERAGLAAALLAGVPVQMTRVLSRYSELLKSWLLDHDSLSLDELLSVANVESLIVVFQRAGLTEYITKFFGATVNQAVVLVKAELADNGLEASLDVGALKILIDRRAVALAESIAGPAAEAVMTAWVDSTFLGKSLVQATDEAVRSVSGKTVAVARTEITAALAAIDRLATAQAGIKAGAAFLYIHPRDSVTRASCAVIAGKVYTLAEIRAMDNGQLPDTLLTCGGYNCRGHFSPTLLPVRYPNVRGEAVDVEKFNIEARK